MLVAEYPWLREGSADRISLYMSLMTRLSACRMDCSRPLASQSHCRAAGEWHMAQSGSILITGLRGLRSLGYILAAGGPMSSGTKRGKRYSMASRVYDVCTCNYSTMGTGPGTTHQGSHATRGGGEGGAKGLWEKEDGGGETDLAGVYQGWVTAAQRHAAVSNDGNRQDAAAECVGAPREGELGEKKGQQMASLSLPCSSSSSSSSM